MQVQDLMTHLVRQRQNTARLGRRTCTLIVLYADRRTLAAWKVSAGPVVPLPPFLPHAVTVTCRPPGLPLCRRAPPLAIP